jgi:hypothetical protein
MQQENERYQHASIICIKCIYKSMLQKDDHDYLGNKKTETTMEVLQVCGNLLSATKAQSEEGGFQESGDFQGWSREKQSDMGFLVLYIGFF